MKTESREERSPVFTLFLYGAYFDELELHNIFSRFGPLARVKCINREAFVQFADERDARVALREMQGMQYQSVFTFCWDLHIFISGKNILVTVSKASLPSGVSLLCP